MGKSNYKLTDEQKKQLDILAKEIIEDLDGKLMGDVGGVLDPYDAPEGVFNNNKFTAIVWYIGEKLAAY
jgi:hypothetical protein